jgi:hypothetical protein
LNGNAATITLGRLTIPMIPAQPGLMTGKALPSPIINQLRTQAILITVRAHGSRDASRGGAETIACVSGDLDNALEDGRSTSAPRTAPQAPSRRCRRKRRRPMTARAVRRAFIRKHNRRVRGRALWEQRREG